MCICGYPRYTRLSSKKCIKQSILDSWCLVGGVVTDFLRQRKDLLLLPAKPSNAGAPPVAHALVGGLGPSRGYTTGTWSKALAASARPCRDGARIQLNDQFSFDCQPLLVAGPGLAVVGGWHLSPNA